MTDDTDTIPDDSTLGASEVDSGPPDLASEVVRLTDEVAGLRDRLLRASAETENVRRRLEREKADASTYALTGFARDLLGVADNLARAVAALPADALGFDAVKTGIAATERELTAVLSRHGITRIDAGGKLDPNRHQAMLEVDSDAHEAGSIVAELQAGYTIKDRLLRPALVSVAKGRSSDAAAGDGAPGDGAAGNAAAGADA